MSETHFDRDTALTARGDGIHEGRIDTGWWVVRGPNDRCEYRWAIGKPPLSGAARVVVGGWIRTAEPRVADAPLLAAFTDAWPPACFAIASTPEGVGPVPTVDLTIHFRRDLPLAGAAADDFYLAVFRSRFAEQGFVEEDGEVWSRDGQLIAQSRQLAVVG